MQQEQTTALAAESDPSEMPPEVRLEKFTNSGRLRLRITSSLQIPQETLVLLAQDENLISDMITVAVKRYEEEELEEDASIQFSWDLVQMDGDAIDIKLNFDAPLSISQDDEADLIYIQLSLSQFEDSNGKTLPESLIKMFEVPR